MYIQCQADGRQRYGDTGSGRTLHTDGRYGVRSHIAHTEVLYVLTFLACVCNVRPDPISLDPVSLINCGHFFHYG